MPQDLPESVRAARLVLVAILTELQLVMDSLAGMAKRYEPEGSSKDRDTIAKLDDIQVTETLKHLTMRGHASTKQGIEKSAPRMMHKPECRWLSMAASLKQIASPRRFAWVALREEEFAKLLGRFKGLNENLYQLLHGEQSRHLIDLTRKTQLDMVLVLKSVEELKHLHIAATLLSERAPCESANDSIYSRSDETLTSLADFKQMNAAFESPQNPQLTYDDTKKDTLLHSSRITFVDNDEDMNHAYIPSTRVAGVLDNHKAEQRMVWIEWREYVPRLNPETDTMVAPDDSVRQVRDLVGLLKSKKLDEFCAPICHGYFDDQDDNMQEEQSCRFGLVFENPHISITSNVPSTLNALLRQPAPSLSARIQLAQKLCTCLLYLHAVNWLHKGINSRNVLFSDPDDLSKPYLSGFEYARPDTAQDKTQPGGWQDVDPRDEMYRHPAYQGMGPKKNYQKTYDIYSLGVVLLEIAFWKPIESIMGLEGQPFDRTVVSSIKEKLTRPNSEQMKELRARVGDNYQKAAWSCLVGRAAFDVDEDADETDVLVATKLQRGFMERVVDIMGAIHM